MRHLLAACLALLLSLTACRSKSGGAERAPSVRALPERPSSAAIQANAPTHGTPAPPDVAAPPADAQRSASGLCWKVLVPGVGKVHPVPSDTVQVRYTGWTTDGRMFDSSRADGQPAELRLDGLMKGWAEGVPLMVAGEKRRFWIPAELAYNPRSGRPATMLVFDIELSGIGRLPR